MLCGWVNGTCSTHVRALNGGTSSTWPASEPVNQLFGSIQVCTHPGWSAFPPWLQSTEGRWWYRLAGWPSLPGYRVQRGGGGTDWLASLPSLATEYRGEVTVQTGWLAFLPWLQSTEGRWWYQLAGQPSLPGYRVQRGGGDTDWLVSLPSLATEGRWWYRLAGQPSLPGYRVQRGGGGTNWLVSLPSLATECGGEVVVQTGWGLHCGSSLCLGSSLGVGPQRRWPGGGGCSCPAG